MTSIAPLALLAAHSWVASTQSQLQNQVVIMCPPVEDGAAFEKTTRQIDTAAEFAKTFPNTEYVKLKVQPNWIIVISKRLPQIRQQLNRDSVLQAFLRHADSRGIVRFGDLTEDERKSALDLLVGPGSEIELLGEDAKEIHIALRPILCMTSTNGERTVEHRISGQSSDNDRGVMADLTSHGVPYRQPSRDDQDKAARALLQLARDDYGICIRYYGIPESQWLAASKKGLDELERYLHDADQRLGSTYSALSTKLAEGVLAEFGGALPSAPLPPTQVPDRFMRSFVNSMRSYPGQFGIEDRTSAEQYLSKLTSVSFDVAYEIMFVRKSGQDENGNAVQAAGFAVQIGRG